MLAPALKAGTLLGVQGVRRGNGNWALSAGAAVVVFALDDPGARPEGPALQPVLLVGHASVGAALCLSRDL